MRSGAPVRFTEAVHQSESVGCTQRWLNHNPASSPSGKLSRAQTRLGIGGQWQRGGPELETA